MLKEVSLNTSAANFGVIVIRNTEDKGGAIWPFLPGIGIFIYPPGIGLRVIK